MAVDSRQNHAEIRPEQARGRPSDAACAATTISIVLFLIGLVLAIATNSLSGSSALLGTIKSRLFSPLLVPAWLDLGFDHRLTYGLPDDADHELQIVGRGRPADETMFFPGSLRGERATRWRRLARTIALGAADGDGSPVAAGVGQAAFAFAGIDDVTVRVRRLPQPARLAREAASDGERVFTARVRKIGGEVQLIKDEPRGQLAPLVRPTGDGATP